MLHGRLIPGSIFRNENENRACEGYLPGAHSQTLHLVATFNLQNTSCFAWLKWSSHKLKDEILYAKKKYHRVKTNIHAHYFFLAKFIVSNVAGSNQVI